jgi:polyisoprenoid-binding protein YceI
MMDFTIPGGGTSPSMVEVVCPEGTVTVSRSDFGFKKRMLGK